MPILKDLVRPMGGTEAALAETIAAYDAEADAYAVRFGSTDLSPYLDGLLGMLPSLDGGLVDLGCGPGRDLGQLSLRGVRATGVDISTGMLRAARGTASTADLVCADLRALPFADSVFAGGWACASLLHLNKEESLRALVEAHRVIRPSGAIFISLVSGSGDEWRVDRSGGMKWFQLYECDAVCELLASAGFAVAHAETIRGLSHGTWVNAYGVRQ